MRPDDSVPFRAGDVVAGRYRVEALLGQGGFGVVYRAVQLNIGRAVALKMLLAETLAHPEGLARFRREAELAQRLEHPNTVRLYDFGETEQGLPFIAWELLRGRPLDEVLRTEGGLGPARVARIATQALKALMEAHALGIVHRDVKPSNLFLCEFSGEPDFVKVLDFGIAKSLSDGPGLTSDGVIVGTPNYMPPEQVSGHAVTAATDLYALGLVMAEALLGRPVFIGAAGLALCMQQISDAPVPLPRSVLASPLGSVIARATQKAPGARFATAAEMLAQIEEPAAVLSAPAVPLGADPAFVSAPTMAAPAMPPPSSPSPVQSAAPRRVQPTMAAAPAPSRTRRNLLLAGALVSVGAVGAVVATRLVPERERNVVERAVERVVEPGHRGGGHGGGVGPLVARRFAQLTPSQIRARIEDASYRVGVESNTEQATYWLLEPHPFGDGNSVIFYRYQDASIADGMVRMHKGQAIARDGNCVLYVQLPQHGAADLLLQRLVR